MTATAAMEAAAEAEWRHPSPTKFGFTGTTTTRCFGTGSLSPGDAFQKQGFARKGSENVVGPMPHFGDIFKTDDEIWKIIAWLRAENCERRPAQC